MLSGMTILYSLFSMIQSAVLGFEGVPVNNGWELLNLHVTPPNISHLPIDMYHWVVLNCSKFSGLKSLDSRNSSSFYIITITSQNSHVAIPYSSKDLYPGDNQTDVIYLMAESNHVVKFAIKAEHIGKTALTIRVHDAALAIPTSTLTPTGQLDSSSVDSMYEIDLEDLLHDRTSVLAQFEYYVTVIKRARMVDMGFNCVMVAIAMLNSFGIGCLTEWSHLRVHLLHPTSLVLTACCQFIILPTVSSQ